MTREERAIALLDLLEASPVNLTILKGDATEETHERLKELLAPEGGWYDYGPTTTPGGVRFINSSIVHPIYANVSVHLS